MPLTDTQTWHFVALEEEFPANAGACAKIEGRQVAVFNFQKREWYACQNLCPHKRDNVLSRGLTGDAGGAPKVACPMHKKTFSLESGECMSGENYQIAIYPVKVDDGKVFVQV